MGGLKIEGSSFRRRVRDSVVPMSPCTTKGNAYASGPHSTRPEVMIFPTERLRQPGLDGGGRFEEEPFLLQYLVQCLARKYIV